jgi:hypothetical protein
MLIVGFTSTVYIAFAGFLLLGLSISILHVEIETLIQKSIDNNKLGRVFGVATTLENIFVPISFIFTGLLIDLIDESGSMVLILSGFASIIVSCLLYFSRNRSCVKSCEISTTGIESIKD